MSEREPHLVNKCETETEALALAARWSLRTCVHCLGDEWSVIHGPSASGLAYFVERGDGGMIRTSERFVARFVNGKRLRRGA